MTFAFVFPPASATLSPASAATAAARAGAMAGAQGSTSARIKIVAGATVEVAIRIVVGVAVGNIVALIVVVIAIVVVVVIVIVITGFAWIDARVPAEVVTASAPSIGVFGKVLASGVWIQLSGAAARSGVDLPGTGTRSGVDPLPGTGTPALFAEQLLIRPAVHIGVCPAVLLPELRIAVGNAAAVRRIVPPGSVFRRIGKPRVIEPIETDDVDVNAS
jgi:hypothetical protein